MWKIIFENYYAFDNMNYFKEITAWFFSNCCLRLNLLENEAKKTIFNLIP